MWPGCSTPITTIGDGGPRRNAVTRERTPPIPRRSASRSRAQTSGREPQTGVQEPVALPDEADPRCGDPDAALGERRHESSTTPGGVLERELDDERLDARIEAV